MTAGDAGESPKLPPFFFFGCCCCLSAFFGEAPLFFLGLLRRRVGVSSPVSIFAGDVEFFLVAATGELSGDN